LNLLTAALEAAGASVVTFSSAAAALEGIRKRRPDVVIADIGMPGMDGLQFIRQLRHMEGPASRTPAAALTAYARSQDRVTSLAAGFQMHLVKPVDPLELVIAVAALAERNH
jgi:CheY-like chemotaxis protein